MTTCLECQRLRQKIKDLEWKCLTQAQRWIDLKRFILDQEEKARNENKTRFEHGEKG